MKQPYRFLTVILSVILLVGFSLSARGQSADYSIRGVIVDSARHTPLVSATVYVRAPKDSTVIALGFTDEKGTFLLKGVPRDKKLLLMIFYTGYGRYRHILQGEKKDLVDLGEIHLAMNANALKEVTITGDKPPIAIRGDTIEFNAASFKTRPNSVLSGLLKKLPGVNVDKDGNITANGKKVDKILVDGKKFFGDDPKIALQNLPAAIVDKVQVTDTKTREEELTGEPAQGDTKTINITLQKGKDHGVFGRAYAGYGTGKHYDASALLNYFEGKRRISLLGATNNINQVGFTSGEITDMMGGSQGGAYMTMYSGNGSFGINGINFGVMGSGLKRTTLAGANFNDDFGKHFSVNGSYFYGDLQLDNDTKTARQNILPDSVFYYNADNQTHNTNLNHRVTATLSYKDSLWKIYYEPYIGISDENGTNRNEAVTTGVKGQQINQSNSLYTTDEHTVHFRNRLTVYRTFKKKGQYLSLYANADNSDNDGVNYNNYRNIFYDGSAPGDSENQYIDKQARSSSAYARLTYSQPLTKSLSANVGYGLEWQHGLTDKQTFDYNNATGKYGTPDTAYSNKFRSNTLTQSPQAGIDLTLDSGKWYMSANAAFNFISLRHYSYTHDLAFDQNQFFVSPRLYFRRKIKKSGSINLQYYSFVNQPGISQLLPVSDNTNPLYIVKGNPDLKPSVYNGLRLSYRNFDFKSGNNIYFGLGYQFTKNDIVNVTTYDQQLRQLSTYTNVNGNHSYNLTVGISKTKKEKDYHWQVKLHTYATADESHAFVNGVPYTSNSYRVIPGVSFTYGYKELLEVTPAYDLNYQFSNYDVKALDNRQNTMYNAGLSETLYWPARITWESDWTYTHNSNVTPGFQKGFWLWNASVGLDLFKEKQATLKFSVYDLLNQNVSVHRNITDTYIEDTQTIILHRFFMLKFIYNLRKFGEKEKKKKQNGPMFFF